MAKKDIAEQFQNHKKLPHMQWVFPSAAYNMDAMTAAWYIPTGLSPFPSQRPELDDPEDEAGIMKSTDYLVSLVDYLVAEGIPINRIVIGGFSQGCAMSLLIGLTSKYAGQFAGILGIAGYLPLADDIEKLRAKQNLPEKVEHMPTFLGRGTNDMLVPRRYMTIVEKRLAELGLSAEQVERHDYEGAGRKCLSETAFLCLWDPLTTAVCRWADTDDDSRLLRLARGKIATSIGEVRFVMYLNYHNNDYLALSIVLDQDDTLILLDLTDNHKSTDRLPCCVGRHDRILPSLRKTTACCFAPESVLMVLLPTLILT